MQRNKRQYFSRDCVGVHAIRHTLKRFMYFACGIEKIGRWREATRF